MTSKDKFSDPQLAAIARAALEREGHVLPETEQEINRLEAEMREHPITLPPSLMDPTAVLASKRKIVVAFLPSTGPLDDQGAERSRELLARAAREGGSISAEVEEEMRRQRGSGEAPEEEKDQDDEESE